MYATQTFLPPVVSTVRLQLVLYDPLDESAIHPLETCADTRINRVRLRELLADFRRRAEHRPDVTLCLGVREVPA